MPAPSSSSAPSASPAGIASGDVSGDAPSGASTDVASDASRRDPAPLDRDAIVARLAAPAAWDVRVVAATGSTNTDLVADVRRDGAPRRFVVLAAERQTAGRGRLGRAWDAAPGRSLTVSYLLTVDRALAALDGVTLVVGLAVRDALGTFGVDARLKWPNDLVVDDRKLAGILVEAQPLGGGAALVVGVGVNVLPVPTADAAPDALGRSSLAEAGADPVDRNGLVAALADALAGRLAAFVVAGFASFRDEWNAADGFADRAVVLRNGAEPPIDGIARGVDAGGALRLDTADGPRRIVSGDVSLRPRAR